MKSRSCSGCWSPVRPNAMHCKVGSAGLRGFACTDRSEHPTLDIPSDTSTPCPGSPGLV